MDNKQQPKLFIALPTTHGVMQSQFLPTVMQVFQDRTIDLHVRQYIDPYGILARNTAAADFLETDCTHLFFLDADLIGTATQLARLLSNDEGIIGGLYPKKNPEGPIQWCCNAMDGRPPVDERGLIPLKHIGTGFMLIRRDVIEAIVKRWPEEWYVETETGRRIHAVFWMDLINHKVRSEDWGICEKARELGFGVFGDTKVLLRHIGTVIFPLPEQVAESNARKAAGLAVA